MGEKVSHTKTKLYYLLQFLGWSMYAWLVGYSLTDKIGFTTTLLLFAGAIWLFNLVQSHCYRIIIIKYNWSLNSVGFLLIKILLASIFLGITFATSTNVFKLLFTDYTINWLDANNIFTGFFLYFIWNLLYFAYAYFEKSQKQEINNLKLAAAKNEIELQNLRTQLNPHFMFNAMNSIKALIDESPKDAKQSVTKLSNILRSALTYSNKNTIPLKEEIALVNDYLSLEKIRHEERLNYSISIQEGCNTLEVPPLLFQTLVENGIKHGISKKIKGGIVKVDAFKKNNQLTVQIINTGQLNTNSNANTTGIGLVNTKRRLMMEYGEKASLTIVNQDDNHVITTVLIPIK